MTNDIITNYYDGLEDVVRRIELLKSSEKISVEEKIKIAELVLSILEEEKARNIIQ